MSVSDLDPFWVEARAEFLAKGSTSADPSACGTCRGLAEAGNPVEHEGCAQRATLIQAPDHPHYEILAGFSLEESAKLPARFHVPVFDPSGKPNLWLCAVCWEEGQVVGWPCKTAREQGTKVFSPLHEAERAQKQQAAELAAVRTQRGEARAELAKYVGKEPTITEEMAYLSRCLTAVDDVCGSAEEQATRWENPLSVPEWVEQVRAAAGGERPEAPDDNRRRLYVDGKGNGWISVCHDEGTEWIVPVQPEAAVEQDVRDVADETGSLREIGRCW